MGKFSNNQNRAPGPGRVLLLPILGTVILILVIIVGILSHNSNTAGDLTDPPTQPTLTPNPYDPGDFVMQDDFLICTTGKTRLGVDVSEHQQQIDWTQVAGAGMEFAFVRIGYRGYTEGGLYLDEHAAENLTGAKDAGLQVGAYFYSQATTTEEAAQEAAFCISFLRDYKIDLPVVFDWEYVSEDARTGSMDSQTLTQCAKTFCQAVEDAGYDAMIYFNPHIADNYLNLFELDEYPFWLSMYSDTMDYPNKVEFWQYTQYGTVPGIPGSADVNLWFID